jgi:AcrR family transcriptional regulator
MNKSERRSQILAHAKDVFARRGYHASKVEDIVASAGVARGTFYIYFEDKRAVFSELIDRFLVRINMTIARVELDNPSVTVAEQTKANILRLLQVFVSDRAMTKILLTDAVGLDPESDRKLHSVYDEVINFFETALLEGQQLGIVAKGDARLLGYLSVGALKELLLQTVVRSSKTANAQLLTDQLFAFLSEGYLRVSMPQQLNPSTTPPPSRPRRTKAKA